MIHYFQIDPNGFLHLYHLLIESNFHQYIHKPLHDHFYYPNYYDYHCHCKVHLLLLYFHHYLMIHYIQTNHKKLLHLYLVLIESTILYYYYLKHLLHFHLLLLIHHYYHLILNLLNLLYFHLNTNL